MGWVYNNVNFKHNANDKNNKCVVAKKMDEFQETSKKNVSAHKSHSIKTSFHLYLTANSALNYTFSFIFSKIR